MSMKAQRKTGNGRKDERLLHPQMEKKPQVSRCGPSLRRTLSSAQQVGQNAVSAGDEFR